VAAAQCGAFREIVGVDTALRWLVLARHRLNEVGCSDAVRLAAASAEALPFSDGAFDAVLLRHLLEHVADPGATIEAGARALAPGGRLGIQTFHRWAPTPEPHVGLLGVAWLPRRFQRKYVWWRRRNDYSAVRLPSRRQVFEAIDRAGLRIRDVLHGPVTAGQRASLSPRLRALLPLYDRLPRSRLGRMALARLDPILRLTAVKSEI
jgi:ubiquinone/menaquinone biosynthesis C-methylase UbiE